MREVFKAVEPSGETYCVFANGQIDGFKSRAIVLNYFPSVLASDESISQASACPTKSDVSGRGGGPHSTALYDASETENMATASGEK